MVAEISWRTSVCRKDNFFASNCHSVQDSPAVALDAFWLGIKVPVRRVYQDASSDQQQETLNLPYFSASISPLWLLLDSLA
jgi:hypothetical protein